MATRVCVSLLQEKGLGRCCSISPRRFSPFVPMHVGERAAAPSPTWAREGGGARCSPSPSFQHRSPARWLSRDPLSNKNHGDRPRRRKKVFLYSLNEAISIFYVSVPQCVCVCVISFCSPFFPHLCVRQVRRPLFCATRRGRWAIWASDKGYNQSRRNPDGAC